ncbi:MAG: bis(5'-nucleosyl)-tetraphosphatase (symmetrical) YqeK [Lachnospiraceae bacterium]|nr:bis(5'-nucleosyl)-tetraphosphatase (symmetrical) YqeK [Lachnospiraceae bacterium]
MTIEEIRKDLKKRLSPGRYQHTIGVYYTAICLAMRYQASLEQAGLAGLLHDCAKYGSDEAILRRCEKHDIPLTEEDRVILPPLHAKLGAYYAKNRYAVDDPDVLNAIEFHTTGRENMSLLEKIIFVADYIEPGRNKADHLKELRSLAFQDLDQTVLLIAKGTIDYLEKQKLPVMELTRDVYAYYLGE